MARVILHSSAARIAAGGRTEIEVDAHNVRYLLEELEFHYPGLIDALGLGSRMAVAIDGEIYQAPLLKPLAPDSEVYFLPLIGGG